MTKKTELTKLQEAIDRCNHKDGCDAWCSPQRQAKCPKLKAHTERMEYCREHDLPIELW